MHRKVWLEFNGWKLLLNILEKGSYKGCSCCHPSFSKALESQTSCTELKAMTGFQVLNIFLFWGNINFLRDLKTCLSISRARILENIVLGGMEIIILKAFILGGN